MAVLLQCHSTIPSTTIAVQAALEATHLQTLSKMVVSCGQQQRFVDMKAIAEVFSIPILTTWKFLQKVIPIKRFVDSFSLLFLPISFVKDWTIEVPKWILKWWVNFVCYFLMMLPISSSVSNDVRTSLIITHKIFCCCCCLYMFGCLLWFWVWTLCSYVVFSCILFDMVKEIHDIRMIMDFSV